MNKTAFTVIMSYVAGGWTTIELSHFILDRFYISNVWTDILLLFFIGMSPTIILIAFFQHRSKLRRIFVPSNAILSLVLAIILFMGKPLGTYANTVEIVNDVGAKEKIVGIKNNYRINIGVADFHNSSNIDSLKWLSYGLVDLLKTDLEYSDQFNVVNGYVSAEEGINKVMNAPETKDMNYNILGSIMSSDNQFRIDYSIYDKTGSAVTSDSLINKNIFELVDQWSEKVVSNIKLPDGAPKIKNLPLESITTTSYEALKYYYSGYPWNYKRGNLAKALSVDSAFTNAYLNLAVEVGVSGSKIAIKRAKEILEKGLPFRDKLNETAQLEYLIEYYRYTDSQKAYEMVNKIMELYPNDYYKTKSVYRILRKTEYFDVLKNWILSVFSSLDYKTKYRLISDFVYSGDIDLIELVNNEIRRDPLNADWYDIKADLQYARKDFDEAKKALNEMLLLEPESQEYVDMMIEAMGNYDLVDISGNYSWGSYTRKYTKNEYGIPVVVYSHYNEKKPVVILDKHRFYHGGMDSIYYDSEGKIYANSAYGGATMMFKQERVMLEIEQNIAAKEYDAAKSGVEAVILKYPEHYYFDYYKEHIDFMMSNTPIDSLILGDYKWKNNGDRKIELVNGDIVLIDPNGEKLPLLALSPDTFQIFGDFTALLEFVNLDSIAHIQIWGYDSFTHQMDKVWEAKKVK
ncbi:MAG: hypothetical protein JXQ96_17280 [Cyclobacteriaceae bacterium]